MPIEIMIWIVVVTALVFDYTNGFHDSANAMATAVSTGAYRPKQAVLLAALMNLIGATLSTEVAHTISSGLVDDKLVSPEIVFAALAGAILWNLFTWLLGLPSSSSHAIFGALIGAVLVSVGTAGIHGWSVVSKILLPAVVAPLVAGAASFLASKIVYRSVRHIEKGGKRRFRNAQRASSLMVALAHGTSDGQKTMGIITLVLVAGTLQSPGHWWAQAPGSDPHWWVILAAGLAMALGTYSGGWRIMRTMGKGMADIEGPQGFAVETSAMAAILSSAHFGFGLSTTHVVSGAVLGTGLSRTPDQVRWRTARNMGIGWLLTLPAAGLIGGGAAFLAGRGGVAGFLAVLAMLVLVAGVIQALARRHRVSAANVTDHHEVRVFGKATEPPATPPTSGALAPVLTPGLPAATLPNHPLSATPLALTRLKQPKKKLKPPTVQPTDNKLVVLDTDEPEDSGSAIARARAALAVGRRAPVGAPGPADGRGALGSDQRSRETGPPGAADGRGDRGGLVTDQRFRETGAPGTADGRGDGAADAGSPIDREAALPVKEAAR